MQYKLTAPDSLKTNILLPSSKSISNRALIINALAGANHFPENISDCDDTNVMVKALRKPCETIDIQAAGTAMRFLTAYLAVNGEKHVLTGTERMKNRPIGVLVDALRSLGAQISYTDKEGFPPLQIIGGNYPGGKLSIPGNISSQYISALLMIGPTLANGLSLELTGSVISRPYIDMTLKIMRDFGAQAGWTNDHCIRVAPIGYTTVPYTIESDWSAASYWYEMIALSADEQARIELPGLHADSCQGDAAIQRFFQPLGVATTFEGTHVVLHKAPPTAEALRFDLTNQPDLAQTLVVTCALMERPFHFTGLQSLKIKETDRCVALCRELRKLGYVVEELNQSELCWRGEHCEPQGKPEIDTYEDHRMAMSFAPACFKTNNLHINDIHVVSKSYPNYWSDLIKAGFKLTSH